ncbi:unnamed protein product [Haemonchus placei]|uniref:Secreted protein n=1 Tax=Haemonchus placei TaxID=6290 RepID=A0A158QKB1_HAEPC|nr:unnamed protein product [Haemonchus placei]
MSVCASTVTAVVVNSTARSRMADNSVVGLTSSYTASNVVRFSRLFSLVRTSISSALSSASLSFCDVQSA